MITSTSVVAPKAVEQFGVAFSWYGQTLPSTSQVLHIKCSSRLLPLDAKYSKGMHWSMNVTVGKCSVYSQRKRHEQRNTHV